MVISKEDFKKLLEKDEKFKAYIHTLNGFPERVAKYLEQGYKEKEAVRQAENDLIYLVLKE